MIGISRSSLGYGGSVFVALLVLTWIFPEWWNSLLAANGFIPHGHCYLWKPSLVWLHLVSDALIALAYVAISFTLAYLVYKTRQEIPFHWMFLSFGAFIVACGSTHFMAVWTLWHPTYWLSGALKAITAIASVTTASVLPFLVPQALALVESAKLSEERQSNLETANHQLEALNQQLKDVDQLKTQFFANVSHELRTPLALILGPLEKLLKQETLSQEHSNDLAIVDRNARLLLKQVNDLLDVSKLEAGKVTLDYTQVDLAQLVSQTAANFDGLAQEKQIAFTVETPETLIGQVDVAKVQRILLNLLSNGFKFTPAGGTIRCLLSPSQTDEVWHPEETENPSSSSSDCAILTVRDSGPGVPEALRKTIFERFSQGERGATRRFGGTGLGLAIAKEFAELQAGSIEVGDAPEGGAQFIVALPLKAPSGVAVTSPQTAPEPSPEMTNLVLEELRTEHTTTIAQPEDHIAAGKPLVLVVEDNQEMSRFITSTLAPDYCTVSATNGEEGLAQALSQRPDLILSDVMMPFMSGDQMVRQLRTHPELESIPIMMLTAKSDDELRVQLLRQGAQDFLTKPFSTEELKARVGNLTVVKRVRDRLQQELNSQNQNIEALVEEVSLRRQDLQTALDALQHQSHELAKANRLKDEFLAIVSHELRTPLNAILGWAKILQTRTLDETIVARAFETIYRNAQLQYQLVENLLDVSRLVSSKIRLNSQPVDLKLLIQQVLQAVRPAADAKLIQLQAELDETVAQVYGDRDRLRQIIENLLTNAIKFTPHHGQVWVRLEQQKDGVRLQVRDTGEGISPDFLPYIFDYFRQADSSNTRTHGGLGLGLAIAQQLVNLHNGTLQAESQGKGTGSTFTLTLPALSPANAPMTLR